MQEKNMGKEREKKLVCEPKVVGHLTLFPKDSNRIRGHNRIRLLKKEVEKLGLSTEFSLPNIEKCIAFEIEDFVCDHTNSALGRCPGCGEETDSDIVGTVGCPLCDSWVSHYLVDDEDNFYAVWEIKGLKLQKIGKLKIKVQE